ncbi:serine/threonine protein kinase [Nemania sp. NC0429]|nr:serine/threonine protein kinase [Nemania sp. NC0429]
MDSTDGPGRSIARSPSPEKPSPPQVAVSQPQQGSVSLRAEEGSEVYRPGGFHPVYIGDVYNERYKILNKIGYGTYSTVWMVEDLRGGPGGRREFLALKVLSAECYGTGHDIFEREILKRLKDGDQTQPGYEYIAHLLDDFEHEGPNGKHICLVFELCGETLRSFGAWFPDSMIPNSIMRRFAIMLICAVELAHDQGVIHTDIQPNNILVKVTDYSLIESKYLKETPVPHQNRDEEHYTVIPSAPLRNSYFDPRTFNGLFELALADWGVSSWTDNHLTENIQPVALRSPEVLIKAPWSVETDFWNLGAVLLEVFRAVRMFSGMIPPDGQYELKKHLAEIVDLFGPFPPALLKQGDQELVQRIFDDEGRVKDWPPLERPGLNTDIWMPGLDPEVREGFLDVLRGLMKINPADRMSATELLKLPWLGYLVPNS